MYALRILLHHISALASYNFSLMLLNWYTCFACLGIIKFYAVCTCALWHKFNIEARNM